MSLELLAVYNTDGYSSGVLVKSEVLYVDDIDEEFYHLYVKTEENKRTLQIIKYRHYNMLYII